MSKTDLNLWLAFVDEAKTHRLYAAYAIQAMSEGCNEAAEAFMEAAGSEVVHAMSHLAATGTVKRTIENLRDVVEHEAAEVATNYPRYIREAKADGRDDAVASFELALARERKHVTMFRESLAALEARSRQDQGAGPTFFPSAERPAGSAPAAPAAPETRTPPRTARGGPGKMGGPAEIGEERERIAGRARIREVVFGAQDGLLTTVSVVSSFFGAQAKSPEILFAGVATGIAGMVAMTAGSYLSSKAEADLGRAEVDREMREMEEHPAEELAELVEIYRRQGMGNEQARDTALAVSGDPQRMLRVKAREELGLDAEAQVSPLKDAGVMALSFIVGAVIPIVPYLVFAGVTALMSSILLTCLALFGIGIIKARAAESNVWISGLESFAVGASAGILGWIVGTYIPHIFGINIGGV